MTTNNNNLTWNQFEGLEELQDHQAEPIVGGAFKLLNADSGSAIGSTSPTGTTLTRRLNLGTPRYGIQNDDNVERYFSIIYGNDSGNVVQNDGLLLQPGERAALPSHLGARDVAGAIGAARNVEIRQIGVEQTAEEVVSVLDLDDSTTNRRVYGVRGSETIDTLLRLGS